MSEFMNDPYHKSIEKSGIISGAAATIIELTKFVFEEVGNIPASISERRHAAASIGSTLLRTK